MTDATVASSPAIKPVAYSVPGFAEVIGISTAYAWTLVSTGKVRTVKIGKRRLVPATEIDRLLGEAA